MPLEARRTSAASKWGCGATLVHGARSPCSASPTTRSHSGGSRAYSRRTSPRSFRGRGVTTSTATCSITEESSAEPWTSGTAGRRGRAARARRPGSSEAGSPVSSSPVKLLSDEELATNRSRLPGRCSRAPARRRLAPRSFGALRADHGAAALIRQLGRRRQAASGATWRLISLGVGTKWLEIHGRERETGSPRTTASRSSAASSTTSCEASTTDGNGSRRCSSASGPSTAASSIGPRSPGPSADELDAVVPPSRGPPRPRTT